MKSQDWHIKNGELLRRQTYNRAGSAKKRGYDTLATYYKALADAKYAHEQNNDEEVAKNLEVAFPLIEDAFDEFQNYVAEHGEMA